MKTFHLRLRTSKSFPVVGLSVSSHILQEETSLMMADKDTDLRVYYNVRIHFIAMFI